MASKEERKKQSEQATANIPIRIMRSVRHHMGAWYKEAKGLATDQVDGEIYNHCRDLIWATFWDVSVSLLDSRTALAAHKCGYTEYLAIQRRWRKALVEWYCAQTQSASVKTSRKLALSDGTIISHGNFYVQRYRDIWACLNTHCGQPDACVPDETVWRPDHFAREFCAECTRKD